MEIGCNIDHVGYGTWNDRYPKPNCTDSLNNTPRCSPSPCIKSLLKSNCSKTDRSLPHKWTGRCWWCLLQQQTTEYIINRLTLTALAQNVLLCRYSIRFLCFPPFQSARVPCRVQDCPHVAQQIETQRPASHKDLFYSPQDSFIETRFDTL